MDEVVRFATVPKRAVIDIATQLIDRGCIFKDGVLLDGDEPVMFMTKTESNRLYFVEFSDSERFYWFQDGELLPSLGEIYREH